MWAGGGGIRSEVRIIDPDWSFGAADNGFTILSQRQQGRIVIGVGNWNGDPSVIERRGAVRLTMRIDEGHQICPRRPLEDLQAIRRVGIGFEAMLRSEEQTSELQSLMRISYAVFC